MTYLLDTNICIYLMNGRHPDVEKRLRLCSPEDVVLSSIVVSELRFGAANSANPVRNHAALDVFLSGFEILTYGNAEAVAYGDVRTALRRSGKPIGSVDMFIAAHAIANDLVLATDNVREFGRVTGLKVENWMLPSDK